MQYQSDYVLRLIEQMGGLLRRASDKARTGGSEEPYRLVDQAIGMALDMDSSAVTRLAPASLASLLELANLDERVIGLVADALEIEGELLELEGELLLAGVRRDQVAAVRALLGPQHVN